MSVQVCCFGKRLSLNHTVYCLNGREGTLNGTSLFTFYFLPKRNVSCLLSVLASGFFLSFHHLFWGLSSAKNIGIFFKIFILLWKEVPPSPPPGESEGWWAEKLCEFCRWIGVKEIFLTTLPEPHLLGGVCMRAGGGWEGETQDGRDRGQTFDLIILNKTKSL